MSDDVPTTIVSGSPDGKMFSKESLQDLEDQLASFTPEDFKEKQEAPEAPAPEPEAPVEEAAPVEGEAPVEEPPTEETPEEEAPEEDAATLEAERHRIEMEQLRARYDLQMAHNARLAGQIGYLLEQQKRTSGAPTELDETDTDQDVIVPSIVRDVADLKSRFVQAEVSQAIALGSTALDEPEAREMREEIITVAANYKDQLESVFSMTDPTVARQMSEAITRSILADAKEVRWQTRHASLTERKAATVRDSVLKKRAATVSGSGSVPPPPQKPKAITDLSAEEADAWLRENVPPL